MRKFYDCPYNSGVQCCRKPTEERCFVCGHNPLEAARRSGKIEAGAMKAGPDGIRRLRLKRA